jgi:hypothetical protein
MNGETVISAEDMKELLEAVKDGWGAANFAMGRSRARDDVWWMLRVVLELVTAKTKLEIARPFYDRAEGVVIDAQTMIDMLNGLDEVAR